MPSKAARKPAAKVVASRGRPRKAEPEGVKRKRSASKGEAAQPAKRPRPAEEEDGGEVVMAEEGGGGEPAATEESGSQSVTLRSVLDAISPGGDVDADTVESISRGQFRDAADCLRRLHQQNKTPLGPTVTAVLLELSKREAVDGPWLVNLHRSLALLLALVSTHVPDDERPHARGLANEVARSMLRLGLPPLRPDEVALQSGAGPEHEARRRKAYQDTPVPPTAVCTTACLSTAARHLPANMTDSMAALWGVRVLVPPSANTDAHMVKYGKKLGRMLGCVESALVKRLRGCHLGMPQQTLAEEFGWERCFQPVFGPFGRLLKRCGSSFLIDSTPTGGVAVSIAGDADKSVAATSLPLGGRKKDTESLYVRTAIDELLSVLPPRQVPTMVGSVGVRIQSWSRFNTRHGGRLGETLTAFLQQHPEHFIVEEGRVCRADPDSHKRYQLAEPKFGGRDPNDDSDDEYRLSQRTGRKRKSRSGRIHDAIAEKWERRALRERKLRSLKKQKVPGFGKKKIKHRGKGTTPHWAK